MPFNRLSLRLVNNENTGALAAANLRADEWKPPLARILSCVYRSDVTTTPKPTHSQMSLWNHLCVFTNSSNLFIDHVTEIHDHVCRRHIHK